MDEKHSELVKNHFEKGYADYDTLIPKLIPHYRKIHELIVSQVVALFPNASSLLDLGIGTGHTTQFFLERFPFLQVTGYDISHRMIEQAKKRLHNYSSQITFRQQDLATVVFDSPYDAAVSVLCIHHLPSVGKRRLFSQVYQSLTPSGIFVIGDLIAFSDPAEMQKQELAWKKYLLESFSPEQAEFWFENYLEEDLPDPLPDQLDWLKQAGFDQVGCIFQHMNYAVFYAVK